MKTSLFWLGAMLFCLGAIFIFVEGPLNIFLVKKAVAEDKPKSFILGALIDAFQNISSDKATLTLYKAKGEKAFLE